MRRNHRTHKLAPSRRLLRTSPSEAEKSRAIAYARARYGHLGPDVRVQVTRTTLYAGVSFADGNSWWTSIPMRWLRAYTRHKHSIPSFLHGASNDV